MLGLPQKLFNYGLNHNFEAVTRDEKHLLSLMFVKPEGLLVYIKLSMFYSLVSTSKL